MSKAWNLSPVRWVLNQKADETTEVDALLLRTLIEGRALAGAAHVWTQLGLFTVIVVTGYVWLLAINGIDILLFAARWHIGNVQRRNRSDGLSAIDQLAVPINLIWIVLISVAIVILFAIPSLSASFIGMGLAVGFMGYTTTINAAFPRLTIINLLLLNVALASGFYASGDPELRWLAFLCPLVGLCYLTLMRHSHKVIVNAAREQHRHYQASVHDPLTGLPNRVLLFERLAEAKGSDWKLGADGRLAVLCLDLDGFKTVNDRFGHAAGDWVLTEVGRALKAAVRSGDLVSRISGDEFVILLSGAEHSTIVAIAERILAAVSQPMALGMAIQVQIGISIGIAVRTSQGVLPEDLLMQADAALYEAKRDGRGCIRFARDASSMPPPASSDRRTGHRLLEAADGSMRNAPSILQPL